MSHRPGNTGVKEVPMWLQVKRSLGFVSFSCAHACTHTHKDDVDEISVSTHTSFPQ